MNIAKISRRRALFGFALLIFCFSVFSQTVAERAWPRMGIAASPSTTVRSPVQIGVDLERAGQWYEAIEHYEKVLKVQPENRDLKYGLRRSKIHFSIERRYADASFEKEMLRIPREKALALFDDVSLRIQQHYVDPLHPTSIVSHGTESLYLALVNPKFIRANVPNASPDRIERMRGILRDRYWNKPVATRQEARRTVTEICDHGRSILGLRDAPVVMEYVFGGCNVLDDYSSFLTPDRNNDLRGNIDGEFVGLGIEMKAETGKGMLLVNVLPDSPAIEGGLMPGDHIVGIGTQNCRNMTTDEAAKFLRGLPGSRVELEIEDSLGNLRSGTFVRREVQVKSIPVAQIVDRQNGVAYIQMTCFQRSTVRELDEALSRLREEGMRSLIWDLRGNPGGLLTTSAEVLDRFISDGVLVTTRGRTREQNWDYSAHRSGTYSIPLVLLVDGDSASASEIVAGAIRDHHRGQIVGRKTFGKWSVQTILPITHSTSLRLTTAKFYSPLGRNLSKIGLSPDVVVERSTENVAYFRAPNSVDVESDADLKKGLEILQRQLSRR